MTSQGDFPDNPTPGRPDKPDAAGCAWWWWVVIIVILVFLIWRWGANRPAGQPTNPVVPPPAPPAQRAPTTLP
jgi:hypothetical protein